MGYPEIRTFRFAGIRERLQHITALAAHGPVFTRARLLSRLWPGRHRRPPLASAFTTMNNAEALRIGRTAIAERLLPSTALSTDRIIVHRAGLRHTRSGWSLAGTFIHDNSTGTQHEQAEA